MGKYEAVEEEWVDCNLDIDTLPIPPVQLPPNLAPITPLQVESLHVSLTDPDRLYVLVANGPGPLWLLRATAVQILTSSDLGETWEEGPTDLPVPSDCIIDITLDSNADDGVYASTCQGIYFWSEDRWVKRSDIVTNVLSAVKGKPDVFWAAEPWRTVVRSDDGGINWRDASAGLVHFGGIANLLLDPSDPDILFSIIRPKFAGSYLRRGIDDGRWSTLPTPNDNETIETGMVIDGETGDLYVTTMSAPAQLWRSTNPNAPDPEFVTWDLVQNLGSDVHVRLLGASQTSDGLVLFANIHPLTPFEDLPGATIGYPQLHRSLDGGETWEPLDVPVGRN